MKKDILIASSVTIFFAWVIGWGVAWVQSYISLVAFIVSSLVLIVILCIGIKYFSEPDSMVFETKKRRKALLSAMEITKGSVNKASTFDAHVIQKYQSWSGDFYIPRKVRKLLPELIKYIRDYFKWFDKAWDIFSEKRKVTFQESPFKQLGDRFDKFGGGYFYAIIDMDIESAVFKGTVDFTQVREHILQRYGRDTKTADGTDSLIQFVDSPSFAEFVDLLKSQGNRPSMEEFREKRGRCLKIIEQIEEVLKTKSRKGAGYNE